MGVADAVPDIDVYPSHVRHSTAQAINRLKPSWPVLILESRSNSMIYMHYNAAASFSDSSRTWADDMTCT